MPLNEAEKAACRKHLGFPGLEQSGSISLGTPGTTQLKFILEQNLQLLQPEHEPWVRRILLELGCIEEQASKMRPGLEFRSVSGSVQFAGGAGMDDLWEEYVRAVFDLADALGVSPNVYSHRLRRLGYGPRQVIEPC